MFSLSYLLRVTGECSRATAGLAELSWPCLAGDVLLICHIVDSYLRLRKWCNCDKKENTTSEPQRMLEQTTIVSISAFLCVCVSECTSLVQLHLFLALTIISLQGLSTQQLTIQSISKQFCWARLPCITPRLQNNTWRVNFLADVCRLWGAIITAPSQNWLGVVHSIQVPLPHRDLVTRPPPAV